MPQSGHTLDSSSSKPTKAKDKELLSALDHFEEAMIKEASGNMGDSLKLYRKAYKVRSPFTS
jgi:F-box protein 9